MELIPWLYDSLPSLSGMSDFGLFMFFVCLIALIKGFRIAPPKK